MTILWTGSQANLFSWAKPDVGFRLYAVNKKLKNRTKVCVKNWFCSLVKWICMDPFIINAVNHWDWVGFSAHWNILFSKKFEASYTFLRKQYSIPSFFLGGCNILTFYLFVFPGCQIISSFLTVYINVLNKGYVWFFFLLILIRIRHWSAHANDLKWCMSAYYQLTFKSSLSKGNNFTKSMFPQKYFFW